MDSELTKKYPNIGHLIEKSLGIEEPDWQAKYSDLLKRVREAVGEIEKLPATILAELWIRDKAIEAVKALVPELEEE